MPTRRWQYAVEAVGYASAEGKSMLWRKSMLDARGGVQALAWKLSRMRPQRNSSEASA
ncbi:glycosyltransferase [Sinorhizobium numidicum]|uniref:glycosyltransferase n=1 Tax=Sinorhizobium numidicum TaxID=680248 RepID=UPI003CC87627